jgi:hypothetical protein
MRRPGFALPTVLVIMLAGLGLVTTAFFLANNLFSTTQSVVQQKKLYISAQSGISAAEAWLLANTTDKSFPDYDLAADLSASGVVSSKTIKGISVPFGNLVAVASGDQGVFRFEQEGTTVTTFIYRVDYPNVPSYTTGIPPRLGVLVYAMTADVTLEPTMPGSSGGVGSVGDAGKFRPPTYVIRSTAKRSGFALGEDRVMTVEEGIIGRE